MMTMTSKFLMQGKQMVSVKGHGINKEKEKYELNGQRNMR